MLTFAAGAAMGGAGCGDATAPSTTPIWPALSIERIEPAVALPGTHLRIVATGLVPDDVARYAVAVDGAVGGVAVADGVAAARVSDVALDVPLDTTLTGALQGASGEFDGEVTVRRFAKADPSEVATARQTFALPLVTSLAPSANGIATTDLYLGDEVVVSGDGFLLDGEGTTLVRLDGSFDDGEAVRALDDLELPADVGPAAEAGESAPLTRTSLRFALTPDVLGVRPGRFVGTLTVIDVMADGTRTTSDAFDPGPLVLHAPVVTSISPTAASRGQIINVYGHGLLQADGLAETATVFLLQGIFTPRRGIAQALDGVSAIVVTPDIDHDGRHATAVLRVDVGADGVARGLGAVAGHFVGTLTPLVLSGPDAIEGAPLPLDVQVLSPRQVVHVRFLPGFDDALARFGLSVERDAVVRRMLAVAARDYAGYNITFTTTAPTDFAEYEVVEVGGVDPNGTGLFGLDNTEGKDVGNLRFDDVIGGFNAATRAQNFAAYGGIFASEFMSFSPRLDPANPLASPRFDDVFRALVPELGGHAAKVGESARTDRRGTAIVEAVRVLGNLIGSTITHEVGHTLGLTALEGRYHNDGDTPNAIMDAGEFRPFAERAELDGQGPAVFEPFNRAYLESILPLDPPDLRPAGVSP